MKLTETLDKINETFKIIHTDVNTWDWRTRPGMEMKQRQAQNDYKILINQYKKDLYSITYKVGVLGSKGRDQAVASFKSDGFCISANDLYAEYAKAIEPSIKYGGGFPSDAYGRLVELVAQSIRQLTVIPQLLKEPSNRGVQDFEGLVKLIKDVVRAAYGDELNKAYILDKFYNLAAAKKFDKPFVLLGLVDMEDSELRGLFETLLSSQPSQVINLNEDGQKPAGVSGKAYQKAYQYFLKLGVVTESNKKE